MGLAQHLNVYECRHMLMRSVRVGIVAIDRNGGSLFEKLLKRRMGLNHIGRKGCQRLCHRFRPVRLSITSPGRGTVPSITIRL